MRPLVSVLVPVYNGGALLRAAVESLLAQTYGSLEVIVIDDGSTDGAAEGLASCGDDRVRILRQANSGKASAMNHGLTVARGAFYAIQDADDLSHPERIASLVDVMVAEPSLAGCFSGHELILRGRCVAPVAIERSIEECAASIRMFRMPAHDPTAMYRMACVRSIRYAPQLRVAEGLDYILRVGEQFPLYVLGACLYSYRVTEGSLTRSQIERNEACLREVFERACVRRGPGALQLLRRLEGLHRGGENRRRDNGLPAHFMESAAALVLRGRRAQAMLAGLRCSALHLLDPDYHKALAYSLMPRSLVRRVRQRGIDAALAAIGEFGGRPATDIGT